MDIKKLLQLVSDLDDKMEDGVPKLIFSYNGAVELAYLDFDYNVKVLDSLGNFIEDPDNVISKMESIVKHWK
jgi:hypothetical protein